MLPLLDATTPPEGLVDAIWRGDALGVVIRGWVSDGDLEALRQELPGLPRQVLAPRAMAVGCMLAPTLSRPEGPDLDHYLDAIAEARAHGVPPAAVVARVDDALEVLGGRPVVGLSCEGRAYAEATLRIFADGAEAPLHNDSYPPLACHRHLEGQVDRTTQLSWYVGVSLATAGGELTIVDGAEAQTIAVGSGDLIVFDGGRFDHRVEPCRGPDERRTLGGFAGIARGGRQLHRWS